MATRAQQTKVGIFVIANVVVLTGLLLFVSGYGRGHKEAYWIEFGESILGLNQGSIVEFRGVQVGNVSAVRVTEQGLPRVDIQVDPDKVELHEGVRAQLVYYSLATGMMAVSLQGGDVTKPPLRAGSQIPTNPSIVQNFTEQAQEVIKAIQGVVGEIRKGLEGMKPGELTELAREVDGLVQDARGFLGSARESVDRLTAKAEPGLDDLRGLAQDLRKLTSDMDTFLLSLQGKVEPLTLAKTEKHLQELVQNTNGLVVKLQGTVDNLTQMSEGVVHDVDNVEFELRDTLNSMRVTIDGFNELVDYLKQDPASLVRGRGEPVRK